MSDPQILSPFAEMRQRLEPLCASAALAQELSESSVDLRGRIAQAIESCREILTEPAVFRTLSKVGDVPLDKWMLLRIPMSRHALLRRPDRVLGTFVMARDGRLWRAEWEGVHMVQARRIEPETATLAELDLLMQEMSDVVKCVAQAAEVQVGQEAEAASRLQARLSRTALEAGARADGAHSLRKGA